MSLLSRVLIAALLLALAVPAWAQPKPLALPSTWYGVQVDGNAFTVELPGVPDYRQLNDASARGTAFTLHSYSLEAGGNAYVVQTALYPADVDVGDPRRLIQAALDDRAKILESGKWSKTDWRTVAGATAADSTGPLRGGAALRQLVLLKGRRFVSLVFMGPAASTTGAEAERFFKSLKMK
jgi:hypothetical protein